MINLPTKKQIKIEELQEKLSETEDRLNMYKNNIYMTNKLLYKRKMINKEIRQLQKKTD